MVSIDLVNERLAGRLEDFLPDLIGGAATRSEWIAAPTRAGGPGDSLIVALRGARRGSWYHHAAGIGGDPLGLICYLRFENRDMRGALHWARAFLGAELAPESDADRAARAERRAELQRIHEQEQGTQKRRARHLFFGAAQIDYRDTPAWHYLNNRLCGYFGRLGHLPGCIRYIPRLYNVDLGESLPAMVAAIVDAHGTLTAVHRTWLVKRGDGNETWDRLRESDGVSSLPPIKGKKVLGAWRGCSIHIWPGVENGRRGASWSKLQPGAAITLAEGIETSLTLALLEPHRRIACVIAAEGFANIVLPPAFEHITVAADADPGNLATALALKRATHAIADSGRAGKVIYPPAGFDDWNTVLQGCVRYVSRR